MVLQILFRLFILWSHGLAVKWTAKLVVRLGIALTERTELWFSGRPAPGQSRRVEEETAARRQRPDHAGHDAPKHSITFPALARTQPSTPFALPRPPSSPVAAAVPAPRTAGAIADDSSSSLLLRHHNSSTATPATHHVHQCSLTVLGKRQHRAQARRSSATKFVTVAGRPPSTSCCKCLCARFA